MIRLRIELEDRSLQFAEVSSLRRMPHRSNDRSELPFIPILCPLVCVMLVCVTHRRRQPEMTYTLRGLTRDDFPRIVEIMAKELTNPPTVEQLLRQEDNLPQGMVYVRTGAFNADGLLVGYGNVVAGALNKPGHVKVGVRVDEPFRNQGVGSQVYAEVLRLAMAQNPTRLEANVREKRPSDISWAERRGFQKEWHLFESKLDLTGFDATTFADSVKAAEASGIRFTSLAEYEQTDEVLRRFMDHFWDFGLDVPGQEGLPKPTFELFKKMMIEDPLWDSAGVILAVDGDRWAALAVVNKQHSGEYYNGFTGVHREYRGRRLALPVKLMATEYVRSKGAAFIRTNNHSVNERMLAVNRKMGYQPEPGIFLMIQEINA